MSHQKRHLVPKNWPVHRKGTAYVVRASSGELPMLILIRDMLKLAKNRKEVKKAIHEKNLLLNGKPVRDEKQGASILDVLTIVPSKKNYQLTLEKNGKYTLAEINELDSKKKVAKIVNKKTLNGKKTQINLLDGNNFLYDAPCKVNDSVVVDLKSRKVVSCLPIKDKANALVFAGKHAGKSGKIESIDELKKTVNLDVAGDKINALIKQVMVVE